MIAISIRQPWASLILLAGKDIENRTWPTKVRGRVLVHAAKGMTHDEWDEAMEFAVDILRQHPPRPNGKTRTMRELGFGYEDLQRGGIVGSVEIVDCVKQSDSPWFMGSHGFVLRDPRPIPFIPYKGRLGFFEVHSGVTDAQGASPPPLVQGEPTHWMPLPAEPGAAQPAQTPQKQPSRELVKWANMPGSARGDQFNTGYEVARRWVREVGLVAKQPPPPRLTDGEIDEAFAKAVDDYDAGRIEYESRGFARAIEAAVRNQAGWPD